MNSIEARELDNVLETARLRSVHRLREALQTGADPNPLDVLVVANYRDSVAAGKSQGPWAAMKRNGPAAGAGAGVGAVLISIINAVGNILAR